MGSIRIGAAMAILMVLCAGCAGETPRSAETPAETVPTPTPAELTEVASSAPPDAVTAASSPTAKNTLKFNEENFTQYFQFGMSGEDVVKKLKEMNMAPSNYALDSSYLPKGFWGITTADDMVFHMDDKDRLYMIENLQYESAKGLKVGDPVDRMHRLYGQEDEYDAWKGEYVYHAGNHMLAFTADEDGKIGRWSVFVNIWNYLDVFSAQNDAKQLSGDDIIQFNENNFTEHFNFGMSQKTLEKKLTDLGIRITEKVFADEKCWDVYTDHVWFHFNENRLYSISVCGWSTAKGLRKGDSFDRVFELYGKGLIENDGSIVTYKKAGYSFSVFICDCNDSLHVEYWEVSKPVV